MQETYTYRPRSVWTYLVVIALLGGSATASFLMSGFQTEAVISASNTITAGIVAWVFVVGPKIVFTTHGIEIHNPITICKIGWTTAIDFQTRFSFSVQTDTKKYFAWAAPGPSRFISKRMHETDFRGTGLEERIVISPSDSPKSDSGVALILALKHKERAMVSGTQGSHEIRKVNRTSLILVLIGLGLFLLNFLH